MGCCHSLPEVVEPVVQRRKGSPPLAENCFPEKLGPGGYKVLVTSSSSELDASGSGTARGRAYARTVVGSTWIFACVFESLPVAGDSGDVRCRGVYADAAAQYCTDHAYEVWAAAVAATGQQGRQRGADPPDAATARLGACLADLDRRFLNDPAVLPQDRLGSGCTGVLLHIDMAPPAPAPGGPGAGVGGRVAAVAAVGPCAAVLGQRQGGFASATAAPLLLAGGSAASHAAVFELLEQLGAERAAELSKAAQLLQQAQTAQGSKTAKKGKGPQQPPPQPVLSALVSAAPQEPRYAPEPEAPAALGFGACKGMGQLVAEHVHGGATRPPGLPNGGPAGQAPGRSGPPSAAQGNALPPPSPPPPRVGLSVQTAQHVLQPADESLLLLGAGTAAALSPAEAVLLMHRFGQFAFIPLDCKPEPLQPPPPTAAAAAATSAGPAPCSPQQLGSVQTDSLGTAGPRPAGAQPKNASASGSGGSPLVAVAPFNAARLVSHQAALAVGRRRAQRSAAAGASAGFPSCCAVLALSLDWPPAGAGRDPPASPAGVVAGSPAALAAAAAAALREGRRGLYRWQQLRAYYKLASRRRAALIARWHELFDRVVGAAAAEAKAKEVTAWRRMGAALQVSTAGKVKVLEGQGGQQAQQPAAAAVAAPAAAALAAAAAARGSPMRPAAAPRGAAAPSSQAASRSPSPPPAAAAAAVSMQQQQRQPAPALVAAPAKPKAPTTAALSPLLQPPAEPGAPEASPQVSPAAIRLEERRPRVDAAAQRQKAAVADDGQEADTAATAAPAAAVAAAAGAATPPPPAAARSSPSPSAAWPPAGALAAAPVASPHVTPRGSAGGRGIPTPPATTPSRSGGGASAPSPPAALGSMARSGSSRLPAAPGTSTGGASSGGSSNPGPQQQRSPPPTAATTSATSGNPSAARTSLAPPALTAPVLEAEPHPGEGEGDGEGADLLSPDADQLAMWAAQAAAALEVQQPAQPAQPAQAAPKAGGDSMLGAGSVSRAAATAAVPGAGSRIPLSPSRADNISPRGPAAGAKAAASGIPAGGVSAAAAR
ncbi:hypothetical protein HYH02_015085 [Chlamydomonas schloesseri]|uniref:Uncharacterized protein n=1 Tax=Chlamydomonas schloesseri TaxID=2026947 RepID=A0A835SDN0_9CHLO|nr:hypothetical protein HYH02_015085 [Chlamydomonas schloesseri]|eukprot:KAG2425034.1 hypothetical protein HYH02_015085 [Chlamydomonas schloesseri]